MMRQLPSTRSNFPYPSLRLAKPALFAVLLLTLLSLPGPAVAEVQWIQLSDEGLPSSDIELFDVSPDGRWVVYTHDAGNDDAFEVWSVPTTGGTPTRLSALLPSGSLTNYIGITPDSQRVIYTTPQDTVGINEAYSVPISGGTPIKLNHALAAGEQAFDRDVSPDGSRFIYVVASPSIWGLYSTSVLGGPSTRLDTGGLFIVIFTALVTPDGSHVVFSAQESGTVEVYSVPIDGGAPVKLNGTLVPGGDVDRFQISPDGSRVVYLADQQTNGQLELYSVPTTGGTVVKLNGNLVSGGQVVNDFQISPEGDRVVYRAVQDLAEVVELYSVPIAGGTATKLHIPLGVSDRIDADISDFAIACDSDPAPCRVVFSSDQDVDEMVQLYSVSIEGGAEYKLSQSGGLFSDLVQPGLTVSPDGEWVVFRALRPIDSLFGFRADPRGPAENAEEIWTNAHVTTGDRIQIEPSGRHVVVRGFGGSSGPSDGSERLWRVPLTGPPQTTAQELVPLDEFGFTGNRDISDFTITADGHIVYVGDQEIDTKTELFAAFPPFFRDGFESGDVSAWSLSTP